MPIHVNELISEVIPEPEVRQAMPQKSANAEEHERIRNAQMLWIRDMSRTAAEGFDD